MPGLDTGLIGLCMGSRSYIVVPPHLAYGERGNPPHVAGGVTLRYDVEILDVKPPTPNDFEKIDSDGDWKLDREEARSYFDAKGQGRQIDLDALWKGEDEDGDGFISWAEFTGPKGDVPPPTSRREREKNF